MAHSNAMRRLVAIALGAGVGLAATFVGGILLPLIAAPNFTGDFIAAFQQNFNDLLLAIPGGVGSGALLSFLFQRKTPSVAITFFMGVFLPILVNFIVLLVPVIYYMIVGRRAEHPMIVLAPIMGIYLGIISAPTWVLLSFFLRWLTQSALPLRPLYKGE